MTSAHTANPSGDREIALARAARDTLRRLGWRVRENLVHSGGTLDVTAERTCTTGGATATLRLLITVCAGDGDAAFLECDAFDAAPRLVPIGEHVVPQLAFREGESLTSDARVDAPPMQHHATLFRTASAELTYAIDDAFDGISAVYDDLLENAEGEAADDSDEESLLEAFAARCDLLHAIVITDANVPTIRLVRDTVATMDPHWLDLVPAAAVEQYCTAITQHYMTALGA